VFFIARVDNERRCVMFRDIGGSTPFCFSECAMNGFESKIA
jgi:hypothetical protein